VPNCNAPVVAVWPDSRQYSWAKRCCRHYLKAYLFVCRTLQIRGWLRNELQTCCYAPSGMKFIKRNTDAAGIIHITVSGLRCICIHSVRAAGTHANNPTSIRVDVPIKRIRRRPADLEWELQRDIAHSHRTRRAPRLGKSYIYRFRLDI
jgi:hypothetical protein